MAEVSNADERAWRLRRIWRLALLLTGNVGLASSLYGSIGASKRLASVDASRLDRLLLMEHRERIGVGWSSQRTNEPADAGGAQRPLTAGETYDALDRLAPQAREAWLFRRVEAMDEVAAARSMDCSKTAMNTHLRRAEAALAEAGEPTEHMAQAIRRWVDRAAEGCPADPRRTIRRARRRRAMWAALAIGVVAAVVGIWLALR